MGNRTLGVEDVLAVCVGCHPVVLDEASLDKVCVHIARGHLLKSSLE